MDDEDNRPTVACLRCRSQKLKCGRELPDCRRCVKQKATCSYPSPPDRKRIAAENARRSKASLSDSSDVAQHDETLPGLGHAPSPRLKDKRRRTSPSAQDCSDDQDPATVELPKTELGLLLLEVYFKRIYNSTLLFNKDALLQLYLQGALPGYLCRAIFAQAAIFMKPVASQYGSRLKLMPLPALYERSWCWARCASQEVLSHADEPTLTRIQALQVLQLYYFSREEIQRASVHSTLAYRLNQLLGHDKLYDTDNGDQMQQDHYDRETRRRCFWGSWCTMHIGSIPVDSARVVERVANLPLPAWWEGAHTVGFIPGPRMDSSWLMQPTDGLTLASAQPSCSLMAELVRLMGIWVKTQKFIEEASKSTTAQREGRLSDLLRLFEPVATSLQLPIVDIEKRAEAYGASPELFTCVSSMYHICRLLMHSSMVPILSGCPIEFPGSKESVLHNAETVLEQANLLANLLRQFLARDLDVTMLWPFTGYGCFLAGSVLMQFTGMIRSSNSPSSSVHVPGPGSVEMEAIKTVLGILSVFWTPLGVLSTRLQAAIDTGQRTEASYITKPLTKRPGYSFEEQGEGAHSTNTIHFNMPLLSADFTNFGLDDQYSQLPALGGINLANPQINAAQSLVPQPAIPSSSTMPPPPVFASQPEMSLEDFLMNSNDNSFMEEGWWTTPVLAHAAQGAVPANQMYSQPMP